jgi:hypothetical protein
MMQYLIAGLGLVIALAIVIIWRLRKRSPTIVLLLAEPTAMPESVVRTALTKALGHDFATDDDSHYILSVVEERQYMIKTPDSLLLLHSVPMPYTEAGDLAESIKNDEPLKSGLKRHRAYLSLAVIDSSLSRKRQYNLIGTILSELAPQDTVALYFPNRFVVIGSDPERLTQLKGPDTLKQLDF